MTEEENKNEIHVGHIHTSSNIQNSNYIPPNTNINYTLNTNYSNVPSDSIILPITNPKVHSHDHPHYHKNLPSDVENNNIDYSNLPENNFDKHDNNIRLGFIRKVYGILSFQLLITVCFVGLAFLPSVRDFMYRNIGLFYAASGLNLIIILSLVCFPNLFRTVPTNYLLLTIWTVCEGYMVATVASFNPPEIVLTAAALTAGVSVALTFYAFTTKTDFTFLGGFLFVMTFVMCIWGLLILIFGFFLYTLYCVIGVILFSIYLIFDTQLILGRFGLQYSIDDYILASLNIYIDIIQLFLFILDLLRREN